MGKAKKKGKGSGGGGAQPAVTSAAAAAAAAEAETLALKALGDLAVSYGFAIQRTSDKGRVCIAQRDFHAGSVIFTERAFVYASEDPERCMLCAQPHAYEETPPACLAQMAALGCTPEEIGAIDEACDDAADIPGFTTLDRARCFARCLLLLRGGGAAALAPLRHLTCANLRRCEAAVAAARANRVFPPTLFSGNAQSLAAARVLAALNTNSHELAEVEGSGLFLLACTMEHDCAPNCSFTTHADALWLTCVRDVRAGEHLSIDYGNNFYMPTASRQEDLWATYEFHCECEACTALPDVTRCFRCPACGDAGRVHPPPPPRDAAAQQRSPWQCAACAHACSPAETAALERAEAQLQAALSAAMAAQSDGIGIEEETEDGNVVVPVEVVEAALARAPLVHPHHSLAFWCYEGAARALAGDADACRGGAAEAALLRVLACVDAVLPRRHHERVVYWDMLAQTRVVAGNVEGAKRAYETAYEESKWVSGADTPPTLAILDLARNTPTSAQEMAQRYGRSQQSHGGGGAEEEMDDTG